MSKEPKPRHIKLQFLNMSGSRFEWSGVWHVAPMEGRLVGCSGARAAAHYQSGIWKTSEPARVDIASSTVAFAGEDNELWGPPAE
jgi:hypothetical protein